MIKISLCDSDKYSLRLNEVYILEILQEMNRKAEVVSFLNGRELVDYSRKNKVDAVFLDINLKGDNGLEIARLLKKINRDLVVAFLTGDRRYAFEAFEVDAVGYLVKPFDIKDLKKNVIKVYNQVLLNRRTQRLTYVTVTEGNVKKRILQNTILYVEKMGNKCIFYTTKGTLSIYESISSLISRLDKNFIQISQSVIVRMEYIHKIEKGRIYLKNGCDFSIGRKYLKDLKEQYFSASM